MSGSSCRRTSFPIQSIPRLARCRAEWHISVPSPEWSSVDCRELYASARTLQEPNLTPVSYIVLGMIAWAGKATPYDLKQMVAASVGNLWSVQHAQLYTEPARLAGAGLLTEKREEGGRRRKTYSVTARGRRARERWLASPTAEDYELRDPGLLKVFFGAEPASVAADQLEVHEQKLAQYEETYS